MRDKVASLTERERACLIEVAKLSNTYQIADALDLSPATVDTYIKRATRKLGASDRRTAARIVMAARDAAPSQSLGSPFPGLVATREATQRGSAINERPAGGTPGYIAETGTSYVPDFSEPAGGPAAVREIVDGNPAGQAWLRVAISIGLTILIGLVAVALGDVGVRISNILNG